MSEAQQTRRISKVASELNVGVQTVIDFLTDKRFEDVNRNSKISDDMYAILLKEYGAEKSVKEESKKIIQTRLKRESIGIEETQASWWHRGPFRWPLTSCAHLLRSEGALCRFR